MRIVLATLAAIVVAIALLLVVRGKPGNTGPARATVPSAAALSDRLDRLERRLENLAERVAGPESSLPPSGVSSGGLDAPSTRALFDRLDILETKLGLLQRSTDDQLVGALTSIEALERRLRSAAPPDEADRARIRREMEEETRAAHEKHLRELVDSNQSARASWVQEVASELGLSDGQRDGVLRVFEEQAIRWTEIFQRLQANEISPSGWPDAMRALRKETDAKLRSYLSEDQVRRLREIEVARFPAIAPR
jgi:hypothetical protein